MPARWMVTCAPDAASNAATPTTFSELAPAGPTVPVADTSSRVPAVTVADVVAVNGERSKIGAYSAIGSALLHLGEGVRVEQRLHEGVTFRVAGLVGAGVAAWPVHRHQTGGEGVDGGLGPFRVGVPRRRPVLHAGRRELPRRRGGRDEPVPVLG